MKKNIYLFMLLVLLINGSRHIYPSSTKDLQHPYNTLSEIMRPLFKPNWLTTAKPLKKQIKLLPCPATIIEVGCFLGASTTFMAGLIKGDGGKLYAVDHWLGSENYETCSVVGPMLPTLYKQFLSNVIHSQLTDVVIPVRMPSLEAASKLQQKADLIYIDAAHDEENVYKDLTAWSQHLKDGGILCGDDWAGYDGVRAAVTRFAQEHGFKIYTEGNFWMYY